MNIDDLTPPLIEQALQSFRLSQDPPDGLLNLSLLAAWPSRVERRIHLHDWLAHTVFDQLSLQRRVAGLPLAPDPTPTLDTLRTELAADFGKRRAELEAWSALYYRFLAPLSLSAKELAEAAGVVDRQFRRRVEDGLQQLTDLMQRAELDATQATHISDAALPMPDYARLFGVDDLVSRVALYVTAQPHTPLISIEGLGGIGKTAIARAAAQRIARHADFAEVIWISARHEQVSDQGEIIAADDPARSRDDVVARLTRRLGLDDLIGSTTADKLAALQSRLAQRAYLIIIDNLETLADGELLIPELRRLAERSRFLITSRTSLRHFPYVQVVTVPELSAAHSRQLITSELQRRNRLSLISAADTQAVCDLVGGLPLALKLIAAQLTLLPLADVLDNLRQAQHTPEALYRYIYRHTWSCLVEDAKQLLISMLLISPEGEDVDWLTAMSGLPADRFVSALRQLLDASLVEIGGDLTEPRYHLHRLTITFLRTDLMQRWSD